MEKKGLNSDCQQFQYPQIIEHQKDGDENPAGVSC
jgi:hypothetical protein